ncbi:MAG: (d)CMP kinase, partial [Gammaproteobacteria bacterium]|nr:(d)CMP kinase [Gammaproteobacteria bacterium]
PGGSGKGTVCLRLAGRLGWHILDSGSLYRLTAMEALQDKVVDEGQLIEIANKMEIDYVPDKGRLKVLLQGRDVTDAIRAEQVGARASEIAAIAGVRQALLQRQRAFARPPGLLADGRDMGTVVFPAAGLKIFLTASPEERAKRRYKQLKEKGIDANLPELVAELQARDKRDSERSAAPLKAADDAILLDTTEMGIDDVVNRVLQLANQRFGSEVV